jgi:hypothetical protein
VPALTYILAFCGWRMEVYKGRVVDIGDDIPGMDLDIVNCYIVGPRL